MLRNIMYYINLYAQAVNILYARASLKNLVSNQTIQNLYHLLDEDKKIIQNPRWSSFGFMYVIMPFPEEINRKDENSYIQSHIKTITDFMLSLNLYGIVKLKSTIYDSKYINEEGEKANDRYVVIKFVPNYKSFVITLVSWIAFIYLITKVIVSYGII